ncbi:MAG TPA: hypothetical protein VM884_01490 [Flavisolibacter sp.]|nr:hypothetical protein [Flavisolibacter sp.]
MRIKLILCALAFCTSLHLLAQTGRVKFHSSVAAGLSAGEGQPGFQVQAVNGIGYKTWSAGIGAGIDYYHTRTVPVFADLRKTLSNGSKPAFIYASGGYNFPWLREADKTGFGNNDTKGGLYLDGGIGFSVPVLKSRQLFFSAGWSMKKFTKTINTMPFLSIWPPPKEAWRDYDYTVTTVSLKTGLRF